MTNHRIKRITTFIFPAFPAPSLSLAPAKLEISINYFILRLLKFLIAVSLFLWTITDEVTAQNASRQIGGPGQGTTSEDGTTQEEDPCVEINDERFCWTQDPITGIHYDQIPDTIHIGLGNRQYMSSKSLGLIHTGNLYSPHYITDLFDRRRDNDFLFVNAYSLFAKRPEDILFYNTKLPYTTAGYLTSGSSTRSNDRLLLNFAGNVNKKLGVGTFLDYVYARGEYVSQATKPLNWTSYVYYDDDQYKATLSFNLAKLANQENGGIQNREYVLNPDQQTNTTFTTPYTMPTNLTDTWNDTDGWNIHFNHSYDLGKWEEYANPEDSTEMLENFTSIASIFHSVDVEHYKHAFRMDENADNTDAQDFYSNHYINTSTTQDSTSYLNFSTYAGIRINEGFSKWSQFGLSAFIGYQRQSYTMMQDTLDYSFIDRTHASNNIFVGGQISRHQSKRLTFDVTAKIGISGDKAGDVDITGQLQTVLPVGKDSITVKGSGYFRNQKVSYLMNHYFSNHFKWSESFDPEQKLNLQALLRYSLTGTEAKVGIEHISNYHYFSAEDYLPHECNDMVEVFSIEASQKLHWKAIHFNNRVLFQKSTQESVLALPKLTWESDLSLRFVIAHALTTELGVTGYYTTKYYAPTYQPATQQFAVQNEIKCGGYPVFNAYINCNLKKIKFYIMYSGFGTKLISNDTFLMPYYPLQSTRLEYGVIFDLQN